MSITLLSSNNFIIFLVLLIIILIYIIIKSDYQISSKLLSKISKYKFKEQFNFLNSKFLTNLKKIELIFTLKSCLNYNINFFNLENRLYYFFYTFFKIFKSLDILFF